MPYLARTYQIGQSLLYHIYNRGNAKKDIFHDEEDYRYFVSILSAYSDKNKIKIYHWVLMPNHYHILAEFEMSKSISSVMAGMARAYVHYYHRKYQSAGHLFQGRFKSQPVEKEAYFLACGRYIERNPVSAGLSAVAEEYPFSSAPFYIYGKDDHLTREDPFLNTFGGSPAQRQGGYAQFLRNSDQGEERKFGNLEQPCGSEEFMRRIVKERGVFVRRNGRPKKKVFS